jgi:hypothetical protein
MPPRRDNPDLVHLATCDRILETAHKHGIKAVAHCTSAAFAAGAVKLGSDGVMLASGRLCMIAGAHGLIYAPISISASSTAHCAPCISRSAYEPCTTGRGKESLMTARSGISKRLTSCVG